jgi:hypoxanthine phosphoribosyltransferase
MTISNTNFINISNKELAGLVDQIYQQIVASAWRPDYIVGITRGGLVPAVMLSHKLDCTMHALGVSLRDHTATESNFWMAEDAFGYQHDSVQHLSLEKKQILIVDDINDSGATLNWIRQDWQASCAAWRPDDWESVWGQNVRVAVLLDKKSSACTIPIEYRGRTLSDLEANSWIVFPYETAPNNIS